MGTHFSFLFSIYSENHGVQAEPLNFARSPDITYVPIYEVEKPWYDPTILIYQEPSYLQESTSHDYYMNGGSTTESCKGIMLFC